MTVKRTGPRKRTKIVCTIGPASEEESTLKEMVKAGMNVARLNFSHGDHAHTSKVFKTLRKVSRECGGLAVLCDIQGPKIRTGRMRAPFLLKEGERVMVTSKQITGTISRFTIDYPRLERDLVEGDQVFINDGIIRLRVTGKKEGGLLCEVRSGGMVSDRKGCNIPSTKVEVDFPTEKDRKDLALIAELDPEYVAGSFIGSSIDVSAIRKVLAENGNDRPKIIAKIERPKALENMSSIIKKADGIMVARGDLGVEIPPQEVPVAQKTLCRECNKAGKPVIVATQMLESMVEHSRPTRAEASDVFNAVLDGADAVMLSGETSLGKHPVAAVSFMTDIITRAEQELPARDPDYYDSGSSSLVEASGHAVFTLVKELNERELKGKIVAYTRTGHTARMISKYRPGMAIVAVTPSLRTALEMELVWGVEPIHSGADGKGSVEGRMMDAVRTAKRAGALDSIDHVVTASSSMERPGHGMLLGTYDIKGKL
ncbi:MAG: pyruvate kinase [Candidatus Thermoplasmatota archaeon]|jgi:pyruvate kinase|nr:pyruvate kinase [Candidatus Thermoplasmatota archaeon]